MAIQCRQVVRKLQESWPPDEIRARELHDAARRPLGQVRWCLWYLCADFGQLEHDDNVGLRLNDEQLEPFAGDVEVFGRRC